MTLNFIPVKTVQPSVDYSISCTMCCWRDFAQEEGDKQGGSKVSLFFLYTPTYFAALCNKAMVQTATVGLCDISFVAFEG